MEPDITGSEEREEEILAEPSAEGSDMISENGERAMAELSPESETQSIPESDEAVMQPADQAEATDEHQDDVRAESADESEDVIESSEVSTTETATEPEAETEADADSAVASQPEQTQPVAQQADESESAVGDDNEQQATEPTPTPSPAEAAVDETGLRRGDLIEGTIQETSPTEIIVDLGEDRKGMITNRELERMGRQALEQMQVGERVLVYVVNPSDHEGKTILSVNRAIEEQDWRNALEYADNKEVYQGNVAGYNKGGLIVRFGRLRGFVPQSQISDERQAKITGDTPEARFSGMVNDTIHVKVMEVDRSRNRLILSERAASRERRDERKEQLIQELSVGEVRQGTVVSLEDFGAFVDIGGAEGLVHLTEIAWKHVTHPKEVLDIGQTVKVEVISIDPKRKRIGLSVKRQEADPWDEVATAFQVGDLVQATITKLTKFGAFARLIDAEEIEGLVHISELSDHRVGHPREVVEEGEKLTLRVVKIDVKNRRLGLSLKRVNSAEYLDRDLKTFASETDD